MIDPSFGVEKLPEGPLDWAGANDIEANLRALILAWPDFITNTILHSVGSYGYLQLDEQSSAAPGVEVEIVQHLPQLRVYLTGDGLDHLHWEGFGWYESGGALCYDMTEVSVYNANAALSTLLFHADGDVDALATLAGYNPNWEPGGLLLYGYGQTRLLFHDRASWGLARALKGTWGGAKPLTWGEAAQLRKP